MEDKTQIDLDQLGTVFVQGDRGVRNAHGGSSRGISARRLLIASPTAKA